MSTGSFAVDDEETLEYLNSSNGMELVVIKIKGSNKFAITLLLWDPSGKDYKPIYLYDRTMEGGEETWHFTENTEKCWRFNTIETADLVIKKIMKQLDTSFKRVNKGGEESKVKIICSD